MKDEMIGSLVFISWTKWNNFKSKYPLKYDDLDGAIVKNIDEKIIIIEKKRIEKILGKNLGKLLI